MNIRKGFTLIELLVVIAIIGAIASIVLASVTIARDKGYDAAIKENLSTIRAQAELYHEINNSYGSAVFPLGNCAITAGTLFEDSNIYGAITAAGVASGGIGMNRATCISGPTSPATAWAVSVPLKTAPGESWCIDSLGNTKQRVGAITTTDC